MALLASLSLGLLLYVTNSLKSFVFLVFPYVCHPSVGLHQHHCTTNTNRIVLYDPLEIETEVSKWYSARSRSLLVLLLRAHALGSIHPHRALYAGHRTNAKHKNGQEHNEHNEKRRDQARGKDLILAQEGPVRRRGGRDLHRVVERRRRGCESLIGGALGEGKRGEGSAREEHEVRREEGGERLEPVGEDGLCRPRSDDCFAG